MGILRRVNKSCRQIQQCFVKAADGTGPNTPTAASSAESPSASSCLEGEALDDAQTLCAAVMSVPWNCLSPDPTSITAGQVTATQLISPSCLRPSANHGLATIRPSTSSEYLHLYVSVGPHFPVSPLQITILDLNTTVVDPRHFQLVVPDCRLCWFEAAPAPLAHGASPSSCPNTASLALSTAARWATSSHPSPTPQEASPLPPTHCCVMPRPQHQSLRQPWRTPLLSGEATLVPGIVLRSWP